MINTFDQFYDRINGEMYKDVPPPVQYDLASYALQITSSPISNVEGGGHELRPISDEDMGRYAADDVVDHYAKMHKGKNPNRLGKEMTDGQFKKFMGHTW